MRYQVQDDWIEGSGSGEAPHWHDCSHTNNYNSVRAFAGSWCHLRSIKNDPSDIFTGKSLSEVEFRETTGRHLYSTSDIRRNARLINEKIHVASTTCNLIPLHMTSPAHRHIEIGLGTSHHDSSCITERVDSDIGIFEDIFRVIPIWQPVLLCVCCLWISVTKMWDRFIYQCVCKGYIGHANILDPNSSWLPNKQLYIVLPDMVK